MTFVSNSAILLLLVFHFSLGGSLLQSGTSSLDLFNNFKLKNFRVEKVPNDYSTANLKWTIESKQNSQDSNRVLNVTTVTSGAQHKIIQDARITMSEKICEKLPNNENKALCNYTISLGKCLNYVMRLGADANIAGLSTIPIKPSSLKVALDGITSNRATLAVELDIECDSDYITYVDFDIFDKDTNQRYFDTLTADCEERSCRSKKEVNKLKYCRPYSTRVDANNIRDFNTPPDISNLQLVEFRGKNAVINWSIDPPNCKLNPPPLVEKYNQTTPGNGRRNTHIPIQKQNLSCSNGSCKFEIELEGCSKYAIYPTRLKSNSITVTRPSIHNVSVEINEFQDGEVLVAWETGCLHDQEIFTGTLMNTLTNEKTTLDLNANCSRNLRCRAIVQSKLTPCSQYQILIDGSNDFATFESSISDMKNLTVTAVGENNVAIEWDDYSECPNRMRTTPIKVQFESKDQKSVEQISVPESCVRQPNSLIARSRLLIDGFNRISCLDNTANEINVVLLPCTSYDVYFFLGSSTSTNSVELTTFLNNKAIQGLELPSISSRTVDNEIEINVTLSGVVKTCATKIKTLEIALPSFIEDIETNLTCAPLRNERSSIRCSGRISSDGLDICESHQLRLRTLFGITSLSYWNLEMNRTLQALEDRANDYEPIARLVYLNSSITAEIEWSDPLCLQLKIDYWDVEISNETHEQHLRIFKEQMQALVQLLDNSYQYKLVTSDAALQVTMRNKNGRNTESIRGFELVACSKYIVKLSPRTQHGPWEMSKFDHIKQFTTGIGNAVSSSLETATADSLDVIISYPKRCLDYGLLVQNSAIAKIDGHEFQLSLTAENSCESDICSTRLQREKVLHPCTNYNISTGENFKRFLTPPDFASGSPRNIERKIGSDTIEFTWDPPSCTKQKVVFWHFKLWVFGTDEVIDEILHPSNRSMRVQFTAFNTSKENCFNITYQIGAIFPANVTIFSKTETFANSNCIGKSQLPQSVGTLANSSFITPRASTYSNGNSNGWLHGFGWDIMPWLILFAGLAAGYLLVSGVVLLIVHLRRRKKNTRNRKIPERALCMSELKKSLI